MLQNLLSFLFPNKKTVPEIIRTVNAGYIIDQELGSFYNKNGYVIFKNAIADKEINSLLNAYEKITKDKDYFEVNRLISTSEFSLDIQKIANEAIIEICNNTLPNILDTSKCDFTLGGAIFIKAKGCEFKPHQDSALVDENTSTASIIWIPTEDMNSENGTLTVLSGSHKWASWNRPCIFDYSPINKHEAFIKKFMIPLYLEKGDILIFDSALIHGSQANKKDHNRISFNARVTPLNTPIYQYYKDRKMKKDKIKKYLVDFDYWKGGDIFIDPIKVGYENFELVDTGYPQSLNEKNLKLLINKYS